MQVRERLSPATFIGVRGGDIISFGSGQPDLPPPPEAFRVLADYRGFKYGLISGMAELRGALAGHYPGIDSLTALSSPTAQARRSIWRSAISAAPARPTGGAC